MSAGKVSAIVVTWNSKDDVAACLDSLLVQSVKPIEIIIVDNASHDGTPDFVASKFPEVKLIRLEENEGFARGNNLGVQAASGDWLLLLNPDARLTPNWIELLLEFADNKKMVGALGGLLWRSGRELPERTVIDSVGIEIYLSRRVRDWGSSESRDFLPTTPMPVFGVCAAAALLKRAMLDDVAIAGEVFPERFFCYYEDADLAWRAWRRGWQAWTIPSAEGFHRRGGSALGSRFSRYYTHRNRLWMILRNDSFASLLRSLPEICAHELLMLARILRYPYLLKAVWQALRGIGESFREAGRLPDRQHDPIPFKPGVGFSQAEKKAAMRSDEKYFH